ncbi:CPBP family intramembrane glutamic endopeptidase [Austwickia chelonae]|uniref:CPBP family intramembrane glutamic endopeptidase n=1 Tax=Austwickia chelonae TaxID=100225 RepID=UPI000E279ECE|nr:CPBP family intramembrane glutamic endopeptidase [Austwickia chelonae]
MEMTTLSMGSSLDVRRPTRPSAVWKRSAVAAVGMMLCALSVTAKSLVPQSAWQWLAALPPEDGAVLAVGVEVAFAALPLVTTCAVLAVVGRREQATLRGLLRVGGRRGAGWAVCATVFTAGLTLAGCVLAQTLPWQPRSAPTRLPDIAWPLFALVVLAKAFLMQGIPEELWFRGFAWRYGRELPWLTLTVTTAVFTLLHLTSSGGQQTTGERMLYLVLPLGMGFLAGCVRWCTGSVWAAAGVHGGMHVGFAPAMWAQIGMGPMTWVTVGALLTAAAVALLCWRRLWLPTGGSPRR